MNVIAYLGNSSSRDIIRKFEFMGNKGKHPKFNVLITTYEFVINDMNMLQSVKWQYLVIDEVGLSFRFGLEMVVMGG